LFQLKKLRIVVFLLSFILLVPTTGCSATGETTSGTARATPDFQLSDLDGNLVSLSNFRGRTVLVNFWTTWCPSCVEEMPLIQRAYDELSQREVSVLAVNIGENLDQVEDFMRASSYSFPVLQDSDGNVARAYRITVLPTTFIIDAKGIINDTKIGAFRDFPEIEARIAGVSSR